MTSTPTWDDVAALASALAALNTTANLSHDTMVELAAPIVRRMAEMVDALEHDPHGDSEGGLAVGDIVKPRPGFDPLTSGCQRYDDAIVLSVAPRLQLVSRQGDMHWCATVKAEQFVAVSKATPEMMTAVEHRRL